MKMRKQKSSKKLFIMSAVLIAVLGVGAWWYFNRAPVNSSTSVTKPSSAPTNTINYNPPTEQEKADSATAKQDAVNNADHPPTSGTISVVISRASKVGDVVSVRTVVSDTQQGSCDMVFTKNGQTTVSKNFAITQGPTAATCNGDIPVTDFSSSGSWALSVTAKNGTTTSAPATQTVDVSP